MPSKPSELSKILSAYSNDERVLTLLSFAVGRALERDFISQRLPIGRQATETIRHVSDWLQASVVENDEWLGRLDSHGRPLKLMKLGSLEAAAKEADKAMRKRAQKLRAVKIRDGDEVLFKELAQGYYLVRLLTPEALDVESAAMQHCIGQGAYDQLLKDSSFAFYSLRDTFGKPHATLEVENGWLRQCQGKQNSVPAGKYIGLMLPAFVEQKWKTRVPLEGSIIGQGGVVYDPMCLPHGFKATGNVDLSQLSITSLPNDMHVMGDLDIRGTKIEALPDGLIVYGHVRAQGAALARLGARIEIGKDLAIQDTAVTEIPDDILVKGSLIARRAKLAALPNNCKIGRNVDVGQTPIRSLAAGTRIHGSLYVDGCENLTELPEDLVVSRSLHIERTPVSSIPKGMRIGGGLFAAGSLLTDLGTQRRFEHLDLTDTPIKRLPAGVSIVGRLGNGALKLSGCPLEYIGEGLRVVGRVDLRNTPLKHIPADTAVKGELILSGAKLEAVPNGLSIEGTLDVSNTNVKVIPSYIKVTGSLIARGLQELHIQEGLYVGKTLDVSGARIVGWGGGGKIGSIRCDGAKIDHMPRMMQLKDFTGDRAAIGIWPTRMMVEGNFRFEHGVAGIMPAELCVGGNVECEMARGAAAPNKIEAGGHVRFKRARFQQYPGKLEAKSADFRFSTLTHLPASWKIDEDLMANNSKLESIEAGVRVGNDFQFDGTPLRNHQELEESAQPSQPSSVSARFGH
ncbi:PcfJ domain-containing protein [Rhizobium sp. BK176]|uniref:PcfJ domain-containing protein n=1 Tax=Rhizobium sp. BK176 TaxID=2587071 RepID=UPI00216A05ED|nr:PcfJ domain-containing protein [Rhizobium sp. BK176]MCS4088487.1 hypothetical protein [Rhizobium sp. BK176]